MVATVAGALMFSSTSCSKETTCECITYEIEDDGTKTKKSEETRVIEENDADCSRFDENRDNTLTNDEKVECTEKVFD